MNTQAVNCQTCEGIVQVCKQMLLFIETLSKALKQQSPVSCGKKYDDTGADPVCSMLQGTW